MGNYFEFDENGCIYPYEVIDFDINTFEKTFVSDFENSSERSSLFEELRQYNNRVLSIIQKPYFQWIDGSFVTKKVKPNDIDIVSFIDFQEIDRNEEVFKTMVTPFSKTCYGVDAYIVKCYPEHHSRYFLFKSDYLYWYHQFRKTKMNKVGQSFQKGIVRLSFN